MILLALVLGCAGPGGPAPDVVIIELNSQAGGVGPTDETGLALVYRARDQEGREFRVFSSTGKFELREPLCVDRKLWESAWNSTGGGSDEFGIWLEGVKAARCPANRIGCSGW